MSSKKAGWWTYEPSKEEIIKLCQVKVAVDAWTQANQIKPWFILTGKDSSPSWFWVRESVK
jgi:hypothetical protein